MSKAWIKNGKAVTDSQGRMVLCDNCPCSNEQACFVDCKAAIRERQSACNQAQWTDAQFLTSGLADLTKGKAAVNAFAPLFAKPYSGGPNEAQTWSGSYANSAANWCELYALIIALMTTKRVVTSYASQCYTLVTVAKQGALYFGEEVLTLAAAVAAALARDANTTVFAPIIADWKTTRTALGLYGAQQYHACSRVRVLGISSVAAKTISVYAKFYAYGIFNNQGWSAITSPAIWYLVSTNALNQAATDGTTDEVGFRDPAPNYLDPGPPSSQALTGMEGVITFILLTWDFVHHA